MASSVSCGSHSPYLSRALPPAYTSNQWTRRLPPYAFPTAASITRLAAAQISGPIPSPSMNGMIGSGGTLICPPSTTIGLPSRGILSFSNFTRLPPPVDSSLQGRMYVAYAPRGVNERRRGSELFGLGRTVEREGGG